ncbi:hypothetical protein ACNOYE_34565 [Nannocystaceae bacterium ST9]
MKRAALLLAALAGSSGCNEVPEVAYQTEHFDIAPDFDHPICAGTLHRFEDHLAFVESALSRPVPHGERIRFYWITGDLDSWCSDRAIGCYYPGTRVIIGTSATAPHEIVHAVLNAEAQTNLFLEEALAELYSGVGAYRPASARDQGPTPDELLWLSLSDYRFGELDYGVAKHFAAFIRDRFGQGTIREIASVVATGAGPPELEHAFELRTNYAFDELEQAYVDDAHSFYPGLREGVVAKIEGQGAWIDAALRCDEETTLGPLWDERPGMYRTFRLIIDEPSTVDVRLVAPEDMWVDVIDVRRERTAGKVIDFSHPVLSGRREHPRVMGGETAALQLRSGTHLLVVAREGYAYSDAFLQVEIREFGRLGEPEE